ncbi:conjugal transfer protein TrbF [Helicobacter monodelphidis]|uniref:VirB8/TrbF family protein n=1 Tax=Helicobacter sp. 15-1451 TaxID=2004995 RepID=UPI000DCE9697|nr:VirB8/TrbF family protein [Helicobacter sp. 15-1451]RAX56585.1 conjugal transfer protein TrbF [Helicobacter sp. 15-1451]
MSIPLLTYKKEEKDLKNEARENIKKEEINTYIAGREEWLERYGGYIAQKRNWQMIAYACLAICFVCVCFIGFMGTQNKLVPYIVEVDKLGKTNAVATANTINLKNDNVIKYSLSTFIFGWRSVWAEQQGQRKFILDAYNYLKPNSAAFTMVNEYFRQNNPFEVATRNTISITINTIIPQNPTTWQVEWTEEVRNTAGENMNTIRYRGLFAVEQIIPSTEEQILKNPLGVFISEINISKIL